MVDKNLFLYDLAVVAILKNEGHYLKEWLDYHLAAGVDHFYLYDNDSTDNQREVAEPYVKAGLVNYFAAPGKMMQYTAYNDAINNFKFRCRYMAFIDGDEFIFPKSNQSIVEVVDEILSHDSKAAGLAINWHVFGSNGHDKADFSRGVLERFTRRAPDDWHIPLKPDAEAQGNLHVKTIVNPRTVKAFDNPHYAKFFEHRFSVNERGVVVQGPYSLPVATEKIVINHYYTKSREEFIAKRTRGRADISDKDVYGKTLFEQNDRNEEFDDDILRYRDERTKIYQPPDISRADERLFAAVAKNLSPTLFPNAPQDFFAGKVETFLTCRAVASYLQTKLEDDAPAKFFEEFALKAFIKSASRMTLSDTRLFIAELPNLLPLPRSVVEDVRRLARNLIAQLINFSRKNKQWKECVELDYIRRLLSTWTT